MVMSEDMRFTADDYKKWLEDVRVRESFVCPFCGPACTPKNDDFDLEMRGFIKNRPPNSDAGFILAEFGICIGGHENVEDISPFGVPLIRESEYTAVREEYQASEEEVLEMPANPLGPSDVTKWRIKGKASGALGDYLYELNPPYTIMPVQSAYLEDWEPGDSVELDKMADWFECLWPYLFDGFRVQEGGTSKENILVTIYLHKTANMWHIEPLWVFCERFGMNSRALKRAIESVPAVLPAHFQRLIAKIESDYEPERSTIDSLMSNFILRKICPTMDISTRKMFVSNAYDFLQKMKDVTYDGQISCYDFLTSKPIIGPAMNIGGHAFPNAGIIETLCIYAVLKQKSPQNADVLFRTVFPIAATPIWRMVLSEHGARFGNQGMINQLIKHINEKSA
jgi:hypothetical protein